MFEHSIPFAADLKGETLAGVNVAVNKVCRPFSKAEILVRDANDVREIKWRTTVKVHMDVGVRVLHVRLPEIVETRVRGRQFLQPGKTRSREIRRRRNRHRGKGLHAYRLEQFAKVPCAEPTRVTLIEKSFEEGIEEENSMEWAEMRFALCCTSVQRKKEKSKKYL